MDDDEYTIDCSEEEFHELTEKLLENDYNNCMGQEYYSLFRVSAQKIIDGNCRYFKYNLQERRQGCEDVCDEPLFQDVSEEIFEVKTIKTLLALHDNYEPVRSYD